jgi:hypothetical protein
MKVFLQILKENTRNHSSGKMGNFIERLGGGGSNLDARTLKLGYSYLSFCNPSLLISDLKTIVNSFIVSIVYFSIWQLKDLRQLVE